MCCTRTPWLALAPFSTPILCFFWNICSWGGDGCCCGHPCCPVALLPAANVDLTSIVHSKLFSLAPDRLRPRTSGRALDGRAGGLTGRRAFGGVEPEMERKSLARKGGSCDCVCECGWMPVLVAAALTFQLISYRNSEVREVGISALLRNVTYYVLPSCPSN